jgi:hypothetical protein
MAQALAQACESLKHDSIATAQAGLLMAQVKPASVQVRKRNGHLVGSVLAIVYSAIFLTKGPIPTCQPPASSLFAVDCNSSQLRAVVCYSD